MKGPTHNNLLTRGQHFGSAVPILPPSLPAASHRIPLEVERGIGGQRGASKAAL